MSDPNKSVDYSFMKSGHSVLKNKNDTVLTDDQEKNIISMITMFSSNAIINSSKYVELCKRNGITSQDMKNGLIFEVFEFTKRKNFKSELEKTKKEYEENTDSDWEDVDESDKNNHIISDDELDDYKRIECIDSIDSKDKDFIMKFHNYIDNWDSWEPSNTIEEIMKNAINNIKV